MKTKAFGIIVKAVFTVEIVFLVNLRRENK
jgi:hypothetical protein